MYPRDVAPGEVVIEEGTVGTMFYIIEQGSYEVFTKEEQVEFPGVKVRDMGPGDSFGELALLYSKPRSATVRANSTGRLWVMERAAFQAAVAKGWDQPVSNKFLNFLTSIPVFQGLEGDLLVRLGRALIPKWFGNGEDMISKGAVEDRFYILRTGAAKAVMETPQGQEVQVERYTEPGTIIGADILARRRSQQQPITVKSCSDVTVAFWMSKMTFDNIVAGEAKERMLSKLRQGAHGAAVPAGGGKEEEAQGEGCVCM